MILYSIDSAPPGNFTCRNDSSLTFPLAYLCEGEPPSDGYYYKRDVDGYVDGSYDFVDCPDGSDEDEQTCGKTLILLCDVWMYVAILCSIS